MHPTSTAGQLCGALQSARLAGRLLDGDKVVKPFLKHDAEKFYLDVQKDWDWNSRYWEQRALLEAENDLDNAIQYARHAVAIERHPYPLTTLAKLLFKKMEEGPQSTDELFAEALETLSDAIDAEARHSRITVHPFMTLISGAARYLELGGTLSVRQQALLSNHLNDARYRFAGDPTIEMALQRLDPLI